MRTPVHALVWELFRHGRPGLILIGLVAALAFGLVEFAAHLGRVADALPTVVDASADAVAQAFSRASFWREWATGGTIVGFSFTFLALCGVFTQVEPNPARGFTGMPTRLFTLPVASWKLAAVPVVMGVLAVTVVVWAWGLTIFPRVFSPWPGVPVFALNLLLAAWLITLQALVWSLPGFPGTRVVAIVALVFFGIGGAVQLLSSRRWDPNSPAVLGTLGTWAVVAAVVAWQGVTRTRQGAWQGWPALVAGWNRLTGWCAWRRPFWSPADAQFALEFRRTGRPAFFILGLWTLCFLVMLFFWRDGGVAGVRDFIATQWWFTAIFWTAGVGAHVAFDPIRRTGPLGSFSAVRPVPTRTLFLAKFRALFTIWGCGVGASALVLYQAAWLLGETDPLLRIFVEADGSISVGFVFAALASIHLLVGLLPLFLTGRVAGMPWSLLIVILAYAAVGLAMGAVGDPGSWVGEIVLLLLPVALLSKIVIATLAFRAGLSRGLLPVAFVIGWVLLWVIVTGLLAGWMTFLPPQHFANENERARALALSMVALGFPLARVALAPLALARNRHR